MKPSWEWDEDALRTIMALSTSHTPYVRKASFTDAVYGAAVKYYGLCCASAARNGGRGPVPTCPGS